MVSKSKYLVHASFQLYAEGLKDKKFQAKKYVVVIRPQRGRVVLDNKKVTSLQKTFFVLVLAFSLPAISFYMGFLKFFFEPERYVD